VPRNNEKVLCETDIEKRTIRRVLHERVLVRGGDALRLVAVRESLRACALTCCVRGA
jgi:hypothetical protein